MKQEITLGPGQSQKAAFLIAPAATGLYEVSLNGLTGNFEAVEVKPVAAELIGVRIRPVEGHQYAETSIYYSGWIHVSPIGVDNINLELLGAPYQVGAIIRNPTDKPIKYLPAIEHRHWYMANGQAYTDWLPLEMGIAEPLVYPPAPTGMPFSGGEHEADKLLVPTGEGTELGPGETGFAYTDYFYCGRRWNYYRLHLIANGVDLGVFEMFGGWAGY